MDGTASVRWGWLKAMYVYTIFGAGGFGLGMILLPGAVQSILRFPPQDPAIFGLCGSLFVALGLVSILGVRSPLKLVPILLVVLVYKLIWLIALVLPLFLKGQFPFYIVFMTVVFLTFIIGNLIAIPFSYLFSKN